MGPFGLDVAVPEPVSASESFTVASTTHVPVSAGGADDADVAVAAFPETARWILRFEGITTQRPAVTSYEVYLGLDADAVADPSDTTHYVGPLSLFGVFEASRDDGAGDAGAGNAQRRILDATQQVRAQSDSLAPLATQVRLVPIDSGRDEEAVGLAVARLSLEFA